MVPQLQSTLSPKFLMFGWVRLVQFMLRRLWFALESKIVMIACLNCNWHLVLGDEPCEIIVGSWSLWILLTHYEFCLRLMRHNIKTIIDMCSITFSKGARGCNIACMSFVIWTFIVDIWNMCFAFLVPHRLTCGPVMESYKVIATAHNCWVSFKHLYDLMICIHWMLPWFYRALCCGWLLIRPNIVFGTRRGKNRRRKLIENKKEKEKDSGLFRARKLL